MSLDNNSKEKIEQKIGEALGLEMAHKKQLKNFPQKDY